jgi:hypothetical protein
MAFQGGPLSTVGITPSFLTQTVTQAVSSGLTQVYQGSGQSFFGSAGQALVSNMAGSVVNVALNSALGTKVTGPGGLSLNSGSNLLATQITPFITSQVAAGINQTIQKSLQSAGPFGPILSSASGAIANQLFSGLTNFSTGATDATTASAATGDAWGQKAFPGAGDEPPADYGGGNAYTLGSNGSDVVFSLQPANQGPQNFGLNQSINDPASQTFVPYDHFTNPVFKLPNTTADTLKFAAMNDNLTTAPFTSNAARNLPLF